MSDKKPKNKKKRIRLMRGDSHRVNNEGFKESHRMGWTGDKNKRRGDFAVYPTIAPKKGKEKSTKYKDWKEQSPKEAEDRGELIKVKSRRKARKLAAGSWKKGRDKKDAMKAYRIRKRREKK